MKIRRKDVLDYVDECITNSKALGDEFVLVEIVRFCLNEKITVDEKQITEFLKTEAKKNGINMDEPVGFGGNVQLKTGPNYKEENEKLINRSVERFMESLRREKYIFSPIELNYQLQSFEIYKQKVLTLCEVIEMMAGTKKVNQKLFKELDIKYKSDFVNIEDVDRILAPLIYNFMKAYSTQTHANILSSYLTKVFDDEYKRAHYYEFLPDKNLQFKHIGVFGILETGKREQYVELTERQKEELQKQYKKNLETISDVFKVDLTEDLKDFNK